MAFAFLKALHMDVGDGPAFLVPICTLSEVLLSEYND